jgi:hypothetical protein
VRFFAGVTDNATSYHHLKAIFSCWKNCFNLLFCLVGQENQEKLLRKEQSKLKTQHVVFILKAFELHIFFEGFGLANFAKTIFWVQKFPAVL